MHPTCSPKSYLLVGHVTYDRLADRTSLGGTVLFAGAMARKLGYVVRIVTAADEIYRPPSWMGPEIVMRTYRHGDDEYESPPSTIELRSNPSRTTTTFDYTWREGRRIQRLLQTADGIGSKGISVEWMDSEVWHLAPVANEIDADILSVIPPHAFVGVTPQGWLRSVDADSVVRPSEWKSSQGVIERAQAVVISRDDSPEAYQLAKIWAEQNTVVVVTEAGEGATVFWNGKQSKIQPHEVHVTDELGAGDVFAVAFFDRLARGVSPDEAGAFAAVAAALSVEREGAGCPPSISEIESALSSYAASCE